MRFYPPGTSRARTRGFVPMKPLYSLAAVAALLVSGTAYAAPVIDQKFDPRPAASTALATNGNGFRRAQTFTAGLTGTLTAIGILGGSDSASLNILQVVNGTPTFTVTGTGSFQSFSSDGFAQFSTNFLQIAGEVYAFEEVNSGTSFVGYGGTGGYAGGGDFFVNPLENPPTFTATPGDTGFETFVEAAAGAVPEPASWALMITGFGLVGGVMRRRSLKVAYA